MATSDFSLDMLLGEGGFAKLFLGWVDKNTFAPSSPRVGMAVVVKRLHHGYSDRDDDWRAELRLLGRLAHPNIICLLGYCYDEHENLLVYEHLQNGSFGRFLFADASVIAKLLSWGTRLNIMIGVARGLTYLHSPQVQVIHRYVKSSTILLDQDFNAKLGDFSVARSGPGVGNSHVTTNVVGNFGYLDPEYHRTGHLTSKSDVYSYGVVLLETLTGKRVLSSERPKEQFNLVEWVCLLVENGELRKGELEKIMDPRLERNYPIEDALECVELAVRCVASKRKDRPSSEQVLRSLEALSASVTSSGHTSLHTICT